jgi:hypothetical protein
MIERQVPGDPFDSPQKTFVESNARRPPQALSRQGIIGGQALDFTFFWTQAYRIGLNLNRPANDRDNFFGQITDPDCIANAQIDGLSLNSRRLCCAYKPFDRV